MTDRPLRIKRGWECRTSDGTLFRSYEHVDRHGFKGTWAVGVYTVRGPARIPGGEKGPLIRGAELSLEDCVKLGLSEALEPEPVDAATRLKEALTQAWKEERGCDVGAWPELQLPSDNAARVFARVAELLGVEEG